MDRAVLEKAWAESYDFEGTSIPEKVKRLSLLPSALLAEQVYEAAMELRAEGINWFGSDFEEALLEVINKGDAAVTRPDIHISLMEYKEIVALRDGAGEKGIDDLLADAVNSSNQTNNGDSLIKDDWVQYKGAWIYPIKGGWEANLNGCHYDDASLDAL